MAGLAWPYRSTARGPDEGGAGPAVRPSGGFEGLASTPRGDLLYALLEQPLVGEPERVLRMYAFDPARSAFTGVSYRYPLDPRGTSIGDFVLYAPDRGLVLERDGTQGDLRGFKAIFDVTLPSRPGEAVAKAQVVDLLDVADPARLSLPARAGDVGLGDPFAFPFTTIEDIVVLGPSEVGVLNDNNYPFGAGRNPGRPDDTELARIRLDAPLSISR